MTDDFMNEIPRPSSGRWLRILVLVAVAAMMFAWMLRSLQPPPRQAGRPHPSVGKPMPNLVAEGWLNGPAPTLEEMDGKVRVIEAWAYWCGPCLRAAPHTVELYDKYKDRDVLFIGLTSEGSEELTRSEKFARRAKFTWPCGYGAVNTLINLYESDSMPIPAMWVVDRKGIVVWAGHPMALNEEMLDEFLKQ